MGHFVRVAFLLTLSLPLGGCWGLLTPPAVARPSVGLEVGRGEVEPVFRFEAGLRPMAFVRERPFDLEAAYLLEDPLETPGARQGATLGASGELARFGHGRVILRGNADVLWQSVDDQWLGGATVGLQVQVQGWIPARADSAGNLAAFAFVAAYGEAAIGAELWASVRANDQMAIGSLGLSITVSIPATAAVAAAPIVPAIVLLGAASSNGTSQANTSPNLGGDDDERGVPIAPYFAPEESEQSEPSAAAPPPAEPPPPVIRCWLGDGEWATYHDLDSDLRRARARCLRSNDVEGVERGCQCEVVIPEEPASPE